MNQYQVNLCYTDIYYPEKTRKNKDRNCRKSDKLFIYYITFLCLYYIYTFIAFKYIHLFVSRKRKPESLLCKVFIENYYYVFSLIFIGHNFRFFPIFFGFFLFIIYLIFFHFFTSRYKKRNK